MQTLLSPIAKSERVGRYPKHIFQIDELPFTATPFMIAPVLPAETLNNLYFEARTVSDPIKHPLIGWKKEFYFFYVRISDLLQTAIREMFVDPANTDLSLSMGAASNDRYYYNAKGGINYAQMCMQRVMEHYFRDEGEAWNSKVASNGLPIVQIKDRLWMDSLTDKDLMPQGPDISDATTAGDLDRLMDAFEQLRALGIANMTYEDFLRSYGVSVPAKDENKPELLARFTDFQYPSNTIDPATGAPSSALSWVFKNSDRNPKFFKEPGFIFGISVTRPKVYYGGLAGSLTGFMGRAWDWMPGYLATMPETSLKHFAGDTGPLGDRTTAPDGYWIDMRDLLLYGDQWINTKAFDVGVAGDGSLHHVPLPTGDTFDSSYPPEAFLKSLFKAAGKETIRTDGMASLSIKGTQRDYTTSNFANL